MGQLKRWQFWLGLLISALLLWWAMSKLKLAEVGEALQTANYGWLLPGVAIYFVAVWARAWRWHYLLKPIKSIPTNKMFPTVAIGYMGNNIYPARAGEVLRAYVLRRKEGVAVSASLATIVIERIFDGIVMLAFVFINLAELSRLSNVTLPIAGWQIGIQEVAIGGSVAFFGGLAVFLLAAMFPHQSLGLYHRLIEPALPVRFRAKVTGIVVSFWSGLESLRSPTNVLMVFVTSVVIWLLETGKYWFVMHGFHFQVSFFALMLMNGIVNLATTIPAAPGYLGTFDAPGIAILQAYGVDAATAAGYTFTLHAALWLPITLVGAYYMAREGLNWTKVQQDYQTLKKEDSSPTDPQ